MSDITARPAFRLSATAAAALAATALPGQRLGFNIALVWLAMVAAVWVGARPALDRWDSSFLTLGSVPVLLAIVRSAHWVLVLECTAALLAVAVGVGRARGWASVIKAPLRVFVKLHRGFVLVIHPWTERVRLRSAALRPAVRASLLSAALLLVFGGLFVSADAAFASLTQDWLVPDINIDLIPGRVLVFAFVAATTGSIALLSPIFQDPHGSQWVMNPERRLSLRLAPSDWKTGLVVLNVLFAAFVVVQITVLFGGHTYVLETTGLTYSEYAREGFLQLVCVAILTLGVIAAVVRFGNHKNDRGWLTALLGTLCTLTVVILASAMTRMNLYQEAYGFTRVRLLVDLFIYLLGASFLLIMLAGLLWNARWLPRALVLSTVLGVVAFGLSNPDARIARRNIERFNITGDIDLAYLAGLSSDTVPALLELEHPRAGCAIQLILARSADNESIWAFNLARRRALDLPRPRCGS